jgi:hypothetical protein
MTLRTRRILYITCILIFLTAAPLLTLYTGGFRFDFKYRRLRETGSLVVKSQPNGATVVLAGKIYPDKTPLIINNILPGSQLLQVEKDGYHSWQKQIAVQPRVTTFEENIRLFPTVPPRQLTDSPVDYYAWNKKEDKIIFREPNGRLRLFNTLNNKYETIASSTRPQTKILWSPHNDRFIVAQPAGNLNAYWLGNAAAAIKLIPLARITNKKITKLAWDPNADDSLYLLSGGALWRLSIPLKKERLVDAGPIIDWRTEAERILLLEKGASKNKGYISVRPLAGNALTERLAAVPAAGQEFIGTNSRRIALYNAKTQTLLIIDPVLRAQGRSDSIITLTPVNEALWSSDGQRIIYSDGYGVYERYFTETTSEAATTIISRLITRYSTPVANIFFLSPDQSRLLYSVNNSLRVIELGSESEPRITVLLDKVKTINTAAWLPNRQIFSFIDASGNLLALPFGGEDNRGGFFGGQ